MSFDPAWHQLFPGILSPRLQAAQNTGDEFFGFSDPTGTLPSLWTGNQVGSDSSSADLSLDTRKMVDSPSPPSKKSASRPASRATTPATPRRSTRRNPVVAFEEPAAVGRRAGNRVSGRKPEEKAVLSQKEPLSDQLVKAAVQAEEKPGSAPAPPVDSKYRYKPIVARDISSLPVMFQSSIFQSFITPPKPAPDAKPYECKRALQDNILQTIAPQIQLNGRKRAMPRQKVAPLQTATVPGLVPASSAKVEELPKTLRSDQHLADYKRRKMMQHAYDQIEVLVPQRFYTRPSRANVLLGAVDYMIYLKSMIKELETQLQYQIHLIPETSDRRENVESPLP